MQGATAPTGFLAREILADFLLVEQKAIGVKMGFEWQAKGRVGNGAAHAAHLDRAFVAPKIKIAQFAAFPLNEQQCRMPHLIVAITIEAKPEQDLIVPSIGLTAPCFGPCQGEGEAIAPRSGANFWLLRLARGKKPAWEKCRRHGP